MENTIVGIFVILALVLGLVGGAVITPNQTETLTVYQDKIVEVPVEVPVETLVEVEAPNQLDLAVAAFMLAVEDEEDEAGNDVDVLGKYNFDEVEISKIYKDHNVSYEDDITTIDFSIKLRFDQDDESAKKKTYDVKVIFEEDEDTEISFVKL